MLSWSLEHHMFAIPYRVFAYDNIARHSNAYDTYVKNGESERETQRLFKQRFNIARHSKAPRRNSIPIWVNKIKMTGSSLKTKSPSPDKTARTPGNVDRVGVAIIRSTTRSAGRHSTELEISQSIMQEILYKHLISSMAERN